MHVPPRPLGLPPILLLVLLLAPPARLAAQDEPAAAPRVSAWLVLPRVNATGRAPFLANAVFARYLAREDAPPPKAGETVQGDAGREAAWTERVPDEKGAVGGEAFAWAYARIEAATGGVWMARVQGASLFLVNGVPHAGDVYAQGTLAVPVHLSEGVNHLFAGNVRGALRLVLEAPPAPVFLAPFDATLPDVLPGEAAPGPGAVVVVNATLEPQTGLALSDTDGAETFSLPPLGLEKVPLPAAALRGVLGDGRGTLDVTLWRSGGATTPVVLDRRTYPLDAPAADAPHRRTFVSGIDGSVQFYGVRPPVGEREPEARVGLVLSLHGAGVDALGQARSYGPHPDFWIVAPTNRRPFGFDWQDWGRRDAYEVLEDALARSGVSRRDVHVTGHSMGGHGTWHLAANDPDAFASVAPSAGWISFDTYGGRPGGVLDRLWRAADASSETLDLLGNLRRLPVYVLHGTADDNVPVTQAREMERRLRALDTRLEVHYEEGAGHWWDGDPAPGAACVDWPGFFAMFSRERVPEAPLDIDWKSVDPGVDWAHFWAAVEQPLQQGEPFHVRGRYDPATRALAVDTVNVRRLALRLPATIVPRTLALDGQTLPAPPATSRWMRRAARWEPDADGAPPGEKRPARTGPFKRAFDRAFVLVVGTAGTDAEDAALLARARYDAQLWQYRANGRAVLMTDRAWLAGRAALRGRNAILYGNADTNAAWDAAVRADCPVRFERGRARLGARTWEGADLAGLFVHPLAGDDDALVGVVCDTGVAGVRLALPHLLFVSGVGYPDFVVWGPEVLSRGDGGVKAAGFFDVGWALAE